IALALREDDLHLAFRQQRRLDRRQGRGRFLPLAHIDPDEAVALGGLVGLRLDMPLEIGIAGNVRRIDAIAVGVVFPAVINAANTVLLVAPQKERGTAMRAFMVHDPDPARTIAERD